MSVVRIGIPQGLLYHQYSKQWESFFRNLDVEVVLSGETTKQTMDFGSRLDEICLPVKVFYGHCANLKEKVDFIFAPRFVSIASGQFMCPQLIAIPDLLRANMSKLPPLVDAEINIRKGWRHLISVMTVLGEQIGKSSCAIAAAWSQAWFEQQYRQPAPHKRQGEIAVISHPYILKDQQLSMGILTKLQNLSFAPVTADQITIKQAREAAALWGKAIYWSGSQHIAGAALELMRQPNPPRGIIFLTCFSCGPDALIGEMIRQQAAYYKIPCMILSIDEHTAEAGFMTRLEAFCDLLRKR